jgi:hypothetical protein
MSSEPLVAVNKADGFILEDSLAVAGTTLLPCPMRLLALGYFFFFVCHMEQLYSITLVISRPPKTRGVVCWDRSQNR